VSRAIFEQYRATSPAKRSCRQQPDFRLYRLSRVHNIGDRRTLFRVLSPNLRQVPHDP